MVDMAKQSILDIAEDAEEAAKTAAAQSALPVSAGVNGTTCVTEPSIRECLQRYKFELRSSWPNLLTSSTLFSFFSGSFPTIPLCRTHAVMTLEFSNAYLCTA